MRDDRRPKRGPTPLLFQKKFWKTEPNQWELGGFELRISDFGFGIWDLKGRPMTGDGSPMYDDLKPNTPTPKESNLE